MESYRQGLAATLTATALPYGYTLTVWSSGEFLRRSQDAPSLGEIILFVVGAVAAYGVLRLAAGDAAPRQRDIGRSRVVRAGLLHLAAVVAAVGLAAEAADLPSSPAWALAPFVATGCYLAVVGVEQALEVDERRRNSRRTER